METHLKQTAEAVSRSSGFVRKLPANPQPVSFGLRCGAFLLDYILTLLIPAVTVSLALFSKRAWPSVAYFVLTIGYLATLGLVLFNWIYLCGRDGQSLGQRLVGIRIVRVGGEPMNYRTATLRHLVGYPLSFACAGLGVIWMLFDAKQQGWHDKLAGTLVVKA